MVPLRGNVILAAPRRDVAGTLRVPSPHTECAAYKDTLAAALSTLREIKPRDYFRRIAELGIQAAEALDHAHQLGIVHRDIKPANLIVESSHLAPRDGTSPNSAWSLSAVAGTPHSKLFITDFGLARLPTDAGMTMTGDLIGTLRYMSPEQALAKRITVDHRTDIYSLGITLYELLALQPAFTGADRQEVLRQIAFEEPTPLRRLKPTIPIELETIVHKSITKNPDDRYATARELADDLARFCSDQPIRARPPTRVERFIRWSRRHVGLISIAAALLAILTAAALASTWFVVQALNSESAAHRRAQSNLRRGYEAVEHLLTRVADERLLDQPHLDKLRQQVLSDALAVNTSLMEENSDDPETRFDTAKAYRRAAETQIELGDPAASTTSSKAAIQSLDELLAVTPNDLRLRRELAKAYVVLTASMIHPNLTIGPNDIPTFRRAVAIHENILTVVLDDAELLTGLARTSSLLAFCLRNTGSQDFQEMESLYNRGIDISERLIKRYPTNLEHGHQLAVSRHYLGMILHWQNKTTEAKRELLSAHSAIKKVLDKSPHKQAYRESAAAILTSLAFLCRQSKDAGTATNYAQQAIPIAQQLAADFPSSESFRELLAGAFKEKARAWETDGKFDKSLKEREELVKLLKLPIDGNGNLVTNKATSWEREEFCDYQYVVQSLHRKQRDAVSAARAIDAVLAVETDPWRLVGLFHNLATGSDMQLRDAASALRVIKRAIELRPDETQLVHALGIAHYRLGQWAAAIGALERNGLREDYDGFFLAMAHWQLGQRDKANLWYRRAVDFMAKNPPKDDGGQLLRYRAEAEELFGVSTTPAGGQHSVIQVTE